MAGALLGLISGGVLGYAGQKHREDIQSEHEGRLFAQQMFMQGLQQNPAAIDNPEIQKQGKKHFGKTWELMYPVFQAAGAEHKRNTAMFAQLFGGNAPSPAPSGPAAAPTMTKPPSTMPAAQITGPGTAPSASQAAPQSAMADPQAGPTPEQQLPQLTAAMGMSDWTPEQRVAISTQIGNLREQIKAKATEADRAENRADRDQARAQADQFKAMSLQMTNGIREASLQETKLQHQFMDSIQSDKIAQEAEARGEKADQFRQTQYNNVAGSLTKQAQHIEDMVRSATPPDPKTLDSAINDYNRNLRRAKQIGQRYKYDTTVLPDPKKRGNTPARLSVGGYEFGGRKPTVESDTSEAGADASQGLGDLPPPPPGFKLAK